MKKWVYGFLLGIFVATTGCITNPITNRRQAIMISPEQEMQLGLTAFDEMKKQTPISKDPALNAMVQRVGQRIAAAAAGDMPNAQWEFIVFDSNEANAFCLPGGKVGVYKGLMPIAQDENGLAVVIGHEVAHATARHGGERMTTQMGAQLGAQVAQILTGQASPATQALVQLAYGVGAQGTVLKFSRNQESEADHMGLIYMARAGYDPEHAIGFWQRFSQFNEGRGGGGPEWLRTHPSDETRVQNIRELMPAAKAEYKPR